MASLTGSINLMSLAGAKLLKVKSEDGKSEELCVCIPVGKSGITISKNERDAQHPYVNLNVALWPVSERYRQAIIDARVRRGDDVSGFTPPSHQMEVSFAEKVRIEMKQGGRIYNAMKQRVTEEHDAHLSEGDTPWTGLDETQQDEENRKLRNAIYNSMKLQLGNFYIHQAQPSQQGGYQQLQYQQGVYQQPQYKTADTALYNSVEPFNADGDDLPF